MLGRNRWSIRTKLLIGVSGVSLLPLFLLSWFAHDRADAALTASADQTRAALNKQVSSQLESIAADRKAALERYFRQIEGQIRTTATDPSIAEAMRALAEAFPGMADDADGATAHRAQLRAFYSGSFARRFTEVTHGGTVDAGALVAGLDPIAVVAQHAYIVANPNGLGEKHRLERAPGSAPYHAAHARIHGRLRAFLEEFGFYDIFLVDTATGHVVYSVFKELDYGTSLIDGPFADSGLGDAFRRARSGDGKPALVDYAPYVPSYDAPASFIGAPIVVGGEQIGVAIFQMPLDTISTVMSQRAGLGKTGEAYVVGADHLMRSDTHLDREHRTVVASFAHPESGSVRTDAATAALAGRSGIGVIAGYRGTPVLSAWMPVTLAGITWGLMVEVDEAEAFGAVTAIEAADAASKSSLLVWMLALIAAAAAAIFALAFVLARSFSEPIRKTVDALDRVASGDLTVIVDTSSEDEIGQMSTALGTAVASVARSLVVIRDNANTLAGASTELNAISAELSKGAGETSEEAQSLAAASVQVSQSVQTVASATEELDSSIREIAGNVNEATRVAREAVETGRGARVVAERLAVSSNEISTVIDTIKAIAEQTNLLALNATIEAARAGEAGRGFSVVASEVKELARQTATATDSIATRLQTVRVDTDQTVGAIDRVTGIVDKISELQTMIAAAIEEQAATTSEIGRNVAQAATSTDEIANSTQTVAERAQQTRGSVADTSTAATELSKMAEVLTRTVAEFQLARSSE